MRGEGVQIEVDAEAGPVRQLKVAVHKLNGFVDYFSASSFIGLVLQYHEVRGAGGEMDVYCGGDRSAGIMGRDAGVVNFGHGSDFFHLPETAGDADVGLDDVHGMMAEQLAEFVAAVEHFAGGDGNVYLVAEFGEGFIVFGAKGLFDEEGSEGRHYFAELGGASDLEDAGVGIESDIDVGSDGFTDGCDAPFGLAQGAIPRHLVPAGRAGGPF